MSVGSKEKSKFPFPSSAPTPTNIINIEDRSSSGGSTAEISFDLGTFDGSLNTATLHQSMSEGISSPTYTTATSLLATCTTSVAQTLPPSNTVAQTLPPSNTVAMAPDPGLLASLLQNAGLDSAARNLGSSILLQQQHQLYYQQLNTVPILGYQSSSVTPGPELERLLKAALEATQATETEAGMERRRKIVQDLDTMVKDWVRRLGY